MFRFTWVFLALLMLTGCFYGTVYKNSDRLALNQLEKYVALTDDQQAWFLKEFGQVQVIHQSRYLPTYQEWLSVLKNGWKDMDEQQLYELSMRVNAHWYELIESLEPASIKFLMSLDNSQKAQLIDSIKEKMQLRQNDVDRQARALTRFEDILGSLDKKQKDMIARHVDKTAFYQEIRALNNQNRLAAIESLLAQKQLGEADIIKLGRYVVNHPRYWPEHRIEKRERRIRDQIKFMLRLRETLSNNQQEELAHYFDELSDLLVVLKNTKL
ncbi:DUF6279 family lipoprotein [Pseudoalteromonas luteoviolacea]|nr:DUF6279 family lipoprotein [Pseudoalteromonas luteoviolacea]